jgi:hypothetical protein
LSSNSQAGHRTAPHRACRSDCSGPSARLVCIVHQGLPGHAHRSRHSHTAESALATTSARSSTKLPAKLFLPSLTDDGHRVASREHGGSGSGEGKKTPRVAASIATVVPQHCWLLSASPAVQGNARAHTAKARLAVTRAFAQRNCDRILGQYRASRGRFAVNCKFLPRSRPPGFAAKIPIRFGAALCALPPTGTRPQSF